MPFQLPQDPTARAKVLQAMLQLKRMSPLARANVLSQSHLSQSQPPEAGLPPDPMPSEPPSLAQVL